MNDIVIIANPLASKGKAKKKVSIISEYFTEHGRSVKVLFTQKEGDAIEMARQSSDEGAKVIIAAGGDGTINECADGLMRSVNKTDFGIVPTGRGNDFAWIAKIPTELKKACDLILNGEAKATDVGLLSCDEFPSGRYFLNGVGFGFEPMVNFRASSYKHLNGMPSYVVAFLYILFHKPTPVKVKLTSPDFEELNINTQQISVCNGRRMGSAFIMAPHGSIDDGHLDLVLSSEPINGMELFGCAIDFFSGKQLRRKKFKELFFKKLKLEATSGLPVHADGEFISDNLRNCTLAIIEKGIKIYR